MDDGIWFALFIAIIGSTIAFGMHEDSKVHTACTTLHSNRGWNEEKLITVTSSGCKISRLDTYNAECEGTGHYFVTDCAGVCWDTGGKSSRRECNGVSP